MKKIDLSITAHQTPKHNFSGTIEVSDTKEFVNKKQIIYCCKFPLEETPEILIVEDSPETENKGILFYCCTFNRGIMTGLSISDSQTHCPVRISLEFEEIIKLEIIKLVNELKEDRGKEMGSPRMISSPDGANSFPDHEITNTINAEIEEGDYFKIFKVQCCA